MRQWLRFSDFPLQILKADGWELHADKAIEAFALITRLTRAIAFVPE